MKTKLKVRLDEHIVSLGLASTINEARALLMAGRIQADSLPNSTPGAQVDPKMHVSLIKTSQYVSRGGEKLESAMKKFDVSCGDKICMDIGASTGGFTDYMIKHGAKKVYALDVGRGLLDCNLVKNPKVINMENTNFRYFSARNLKAKIEFVTIDVSFISLDKILPKVAEMLGCGADVVAMVKPQFEAAQKDLRKGVVKDEQTRLETIDKIKVFSVKLGFATMSEADSLVKGPSGNIEHFIWMRKKT